MAENMEQKDHERNITDKNTEIWSTMRSPVAWKISQLCVKIIIEKFTVSFFWIPSEDRRCWGKQRTFIMYVYCEINARKATDLPDTQVEQNIQEAMSLIV